MAYRPKGYGFTAEVKNKLAAKYDVEMENEARIWMEAVVGEPLDPEVPDDEPLGPDRFYEALKDGIYLCKLVDIILGPGIIKYHDSQLPFKQMENIGMFLDACEEYGVKTLDLFQTVDLYENQNLSQVVGGIHALGRMAQKKGFLGPRLGPREATANPREFPEEAMTAGKMLISMQMGSNKGANQSGIVFGRTRQILNA